MPKLHPCLSTHTRTRARIYSPHTNTLRRRCKQSGSAPGNTIPTLLPPSGRIYTEEDVFQCILLLVCVCVCSSASLVCVSALLDVCIVAVSNHRRVCVQHVCLCVRIHPPHRHHHHHHHPTPCNLRPFSSSPSADLRSRTKSKFDSYSK